MDIAFLSIVLAVAMILMLAVGVWVSLTLVGIGVLGLLLSGNDQIGLIGKQAACKANLNLLIGVEWCLWARRG